MTSLFCLFLCYTSQSPSPNPTVSYENIRAPLRVVLSELSEKTKTPLTLRLPKRILTSTYDSTHQISNQEFTTTIYVRDKPLRSIVEGLASVHGLKVEQVNNGYELDRSSNERNQQVYVHAEDVLLKQDVHVRLAALAKLTNQPFEAKDVSWSESLELNSSPEEWAKARIGSWPYYLMGMWRRLPTQHKLQALHPWSTQGFWVGMPENQEQAAFNLSWIDDGSRSLSGYQTIFAFWPITSQLRAAGVYPDSVRPEPALQFPYRFSAPPTALKDEAFVKALQAWQSLPADTTRFSASDPNGPPFISEGWHQGTKSLSEILINFCKARDVSFISDAYRIKAMSQDELSATNMQELGRELVDKQKCFVRQQGSLTLIRHPAFWRLQQSEPTFESLTLIEQASKVRRLSFVDYADFLAQNNRLIQVRFDSDQSLLTKFDASLITRSGPALYSVGLIPSQFRKSFLAGEPYWLRNNKSTKSDYGEANRTTELGPLYSAEAHKMSRYILQGVEDYSLARGYYFRMPMRYQPSPQLGWPYHFADGLWIESELNLYDVVISFGFTVEDRITYRIRVP